MHPDPHFHWRDQDAMRAFIVKRGFGMLFAHTPDRPGVVHIPFILLDANTLAFHLSRSNPVAKALDTAEALFVVNGPDGYISPDWYGVADQVPTWNYVTVELLGRVSRLDADGLSAQVEALSAHQEAQLLPKQPWTHGKMTAGLYQQMLGGISGYRMDITQWIGTAKLGQNKAPTARMRAAEALAAHGHAELSALMLVQGGEAS